LQYARNDRQGDFLVNPKTMTNYQIKTMTMKRLLIFISIMCVVNLSAQVTIGALEEPHEAAVLDLSQVPSHNLGLLLPSVELVKLNDFAPLDGNSVEKLDAKGMVVYNKKNDFAENIYPGIYVWEGEKWGRIGCIPATVTGHIPGKTATTDIGASVTLGISVADSPGLAYQWYEAIGKDYTGGSSINDATSASYLPPVTTVGTYYYYCVVSSSCNASADTSDVFTVNVVNLATMPTGAGCLGGRATFDVAMVNDGGIFGDLTARKNITDVYANFKDPDTYEQTYTFTPPSAGAVNNVRFVYKESGGAGIVVSLTPDADYSSNNISSLCTATLIYANNLNTIAQGITSDNALKVDIYAIYNNGSGDVAVKLTAKIKDCFFTGAYTVCGGWLEFLPYNLGADPAYSTPEAQMNYLPLNDFDPIVYGDLYQWGRPTDGHEKRNSFVTNTLATSNTPKHVYFINASTSPYDWLSGGKEDDRWTDMDKAANDPCPNGYKVPTFTQWRSIFNDRSGSYGDVSGNNNWAWQTAINTKGTYNGGSLFLPAAGSRNHNGNGNLTDVGTFGIYWTSTVNGIEAHVVGFSSNGVVLDDNYRANGRSVRCVAE
jgi:uncharacterized protein (TIGR02145 family)